MALATASADAAIASDEAYWRGWEHRYLLLLLVLLLVLVLVLLLLLVLVLVLVLVLLVLVGLLLLLVVVVLLLLLLLLLVLVLLLVLLLLPLLLMLLLLLLLMLLLLLLLISSAFSAARRTALLVSLRTASVISRWRCGLALTRLRGADWAPSSMPLRHSRRGETRRFRGRAR